MSNRITLPLFAVAGALAIGACSSFPAAQPVFAALAAIVALIGASRLSPAGLLAAFIVADHLVHLLKRFIFLLGPQSQMTYYGVQLLPTVPLMLALCIAPRRLRPASPSGALLGAFLALAAATTLFSPFETPWPTRLAAVHQQILPALLFYAAGAVRPEDFARIGRLTAVLAVVSVVYALVQFFGGPTALDRIWAEATYSFSIQGSKVFRHSVGELSEFRAFSYYADPLTWGLFLVAAVAFGAVAKCLGELKRSRWNWLLAVAGAGLVVSLTRTPILGLAVTLSMLLLLRRPAANRAGFVFGLTIGGFFAALTISSYVYRNFFGRLPVFENALLARYSSVGSLEARMSALDLLLSAVQSYWLCGTGMGYSQYYSGMAPLPERTAFLSSHNFVVELAFQTGLLGLGLFLAFYFQWLREAFACVRRTGADGLRRALIWIIAASSGLLVTGYFNASNFMTCYFFLLLGFVSGCYSRTRERQAAQEPEGGGTARRMAA